MSLNIENHFAVPIATTMISEQVIDNSLALINNFVKNNNFGVTEGKLDTTYYSDPDTNLLGKLQDYDLLEIINIKAREFMNELGYKPDCFIEITSWLQLNNPNSYFHRHEHYGAIVSGVVYLQTPENCGDITFFNPLEARKQNTAFFYKIKKTPENPYGDINMEYTPTKGKMILFESWLQHAVGFNRSQENRISISFNIWGAPDAPR